jgi:hypothetical protein
MHSSAYPLESYKQHALVELGNVLAGILEFDNALILANRLEAIAKDLIEYHVFDPVPSPPSPEPDYLDVMGIHVGALNVAAEEITSLTGEPLQSVTLRLLKKGRDFYELCDPQELGDRSQSLLDAARRMDDGPEIQFSDPQQFDRLYGDRDTKTDAHDSGSLSAAREMQAAFTLQPETEAQPPEESA